MSESYCSQRHDHGQYNSFTQFRGDPGSDLMRIKRRARFDGGEERQDYGPRKGAVYLQWKVCQEHGQ